MEMVIALPGLPRSRHRFLLGTGNYFYTPEPASSRHDCRTTAMSLSASFRAAYPWVQAPLIANGPLRLIALAPLAVEVSRAGGLGFIAAGSDTSSLEPNLREAQQLLTANPIPRTDPSSILPVGVGFINWGANLEASAALLAKYTPAAAWFFAPRTADDLSKWTTSIREATQRRTRIWVQIGTVAEALSVTKECRPDVLVVQGTDAGGHGRERGAGIISLFPEVADAIAALNLPSEEIPALVAAGGIAEGRGAAAALVLGAEGIVMGTRFLASPEAAIAPGYKAEVVRARDGGVTTARTKVYDQLRGTTDWPEGYNGRGVLNRSWEDAERGMALEENMKLYEEAVKLGDAGWGPRGRMTTYAGTGVGLVTKIMPAREIVEEVREETLQVARRLGGKL